MNVSSTLAAYLEPYGIWFPEGDGDALRDVASAWQTMATFLADLATTLDAAADELAGAQSGDAAASFTTYWASWKGPHGYLARAENYCGRLASALELFGAEVDTADAELTSVVESALGQVPGLGSLPAATVAGVAAASDQIAASLGIAATEAPASAGLPTITPLSLPTVDGPAPVTLDQAQVSGSSFHIPDPGAAPDFSSLATTKLHFGTGSVHSHHAALRTDAADRHEPAAGAHAPEGTSACNTHSQVVAAGTPTKVPSPKPAPTAPAPAPPAPAAPAPVSPAPATPAPVGASPVGFDPSTLSSVTPSAVPAITPASTAAPVNVPIPAAALAGTTAAAGVAAGAVKAAGAVATKAAGKSDTIPFFPMGGMLGAAMGDDSEDGKRRRRLR